MEPANLFDLLSERVKWRDDASVCGMITSIRQAFDSPAGAKQMQEIIQWGISENNAVSMSQMAKTIDS